MKTHIFTFIIILVLSFTAFSQKQKPQPEGKATRMDESYASVFDIRKFTKVYVIALSKDIKDVITKELEADNSLEIPAKAVDAQFFIEYKKVEKQNELRAFYFKDNKMIILWAENSRSKDDTAELVKHFLGVYKRNKELK